MHSHESDLHATLIRVHSSTNARPQNLVLAREGVYAPALRERLYALCSMLSLCSPYALPILCLCSRYAKRVCILSMCMLSVSMLSLSSCASCLSMLIRIMRNQYHHRELLRLPTQSQTYARAHSLTDALTLSLSLTHTHSSSLSITSQHCFWY